MTLFSKVLGVSLLVFSTITLAASPAGLWKSIDDKTGKPRSLIRVNEANGTYSAVEKKVYARMTLVTHYVTNVRTNVRAKKLLV